MDKLHNIANRARIRMQIGATLTNSVRWFICLSSIAFLLTLVDRSGEVSFLNWNTIWLTIGMFGLFVLLSRWLQSSISKIEAAIQVDHKMQLKDRISSAMVCAKRDDPFCDVIIEDALEITEKQNVYDSVPRHFPIELPKGTSWIIAIALLTLIIGWLPQWDLWSDQENDLQQASILPRVENIEASIDSVLEQLKQEESVSDSLQEELKELASLKSIESEDPELLRRDALRKMTDLQKKLDELMQDENAITFEEVSKRLQSLALPRDAETLPMIAAMKNGDFDHARKELEALQEQLNSSELTHEQKEELARALEELAKQFEKLASSSEALSSALSSAGLNSELAGNPDAAMKAIENASELNEEQKKKLLELLEAQKKANEMCEKMSEACKKCAQGDGSGAMASELEQLEAMKMFMTEAEVAKMACQNAARGMCPGEGTGGAGQGNGGVNRVAQTDTSSIAQRSPVNTVEGAIIAKQLFEGGLLTSSESSATVRETVLAEERDVEQAIADEALPRKYHDLLRHYFGQLKELTETSVDDAEKNSD
ncbi:MAG: hypothetical protein VX436_02025 [Planctomycetota bacterium]|nr:hypothetical protein [Planctomycetota bacterium]